MRTFIYERGVEPNCQIEGVPFFSLSNVNSIYTNETYHYGWTLECDDQSVSGDDAYFILDSESNTAFSHFVFESSTHLHNISALKSVYPKIKIAVQTRRNFKRLFLEFYGLDWNDVVTFDEMNPKNSCFFHVYTSLNDKEVPPVFYTNAERFFEKINKIPSEKTIQLLYLPRGTKENHKGSTNRVYTIQDKLISFVESVNGTVYWTDETKNLEDQIKIVRSAKIIVCDYGSNLWVNGNFATDSLIFSLNIGWVQHTIYPSFRFLYESILKKNQLVEIRAIHGESTDTHNIVHFNESQVFSYILSALQHIH